MIAVRRQRGTQFLVADLLPAAPPGEGSQRGAVQAPSAMAPEDT